jgi:hypothetical protein
LREVAVEIEYDELFNTWLPNGDDPEGSVEKQIEWRLDGSSDWNEKMWLAAPRSRPSSTRQVRSERPQFAFPFRAGLWIAHVEPFERVEHDPRDDRTGVLLVVGRQELPGRLVDAGRAQTFFVGPRVVMPEFPLLQIRVAEFAILLGVVGALQKPLLSLFPREVEEELDHAGSVDVEAPFKILDRAMALAPDLLVATRRVRNGFAFEKVVVNPRDPHFLVIGTVEDRDPSARESRVPVQLPWAA